MDIRRWTMTSAALLFGAALGGCSSDEQARTETEVPRAMIESGGDSPDAELAVEPALGEQTEAEVVMYEEPNGVRVVMEVAGATPGEHGVHVHEKADCSDPVGESMGKHLGPDDQQHGLPEDNERHLGDLGNIEVAENGTGTLDILVRDATLDPLGGDMSFVGRSLVITMLDDTGEGLNGKSGEPIACGVIEHEP